MGLIGLYFFETDEPEVAARYDEMLQELAPGYPLARALHRKVQPGFLRRALSRSAE